MRLAVAVLALAALAACAPPSLTKPLDTGGAGSDAGTGDGGNGNVPFTAVANILRKDCTGSTCHGPTSDRAGLQIEGGTMASNQQVRAAIDGTTVADEEAKFIVPEKPQESVVYLAIKALDGRQQMPLSGKLEENKIEKIRQWIAQGASYE